MPQFREAQEEDKELQAIWIQVLNVGNDHPGMTSVTSQYEVRNHLLYWVQRGQQMGQEEAQLVVPTKF